MVSKKDLDSSDSDDELRISEYDSDSPDDSDTNLPDIDDSDSSPEEIGFKAEKERTKLIRKQAWEQVKSQKLLVRKKRTEIHQRNVRQKEEKKMVVSCQELSSDVLDSLDATFHAEKSISVISNDVVINDGKVEKLSSKSKQEFVSICGSTVFKVKNIKKMRMDSGAVTKEVEDFCSSRLYGRKNRREKSTGDYLMKREKRKLRRRQ